MRRATGHLPGKLAFRIPVSACLRRNSRTTCGARRGGMHALRASRSVRVSVAVTLQASPPTLAALDRHRYPSALQTLLAMADAEALPPSLRFGPPRVERRADLSSAIRSFDAVPSKDRNAALALAAGLWLRFDFMDEAHAIAQDLETREAAYWHAVVHRREPDPGNARYWFARVGEHPVFPALLEDARALVAAAPRPPKALVKMVEASRWDPAAFVAACSAGPEDDPLLLAIQLREWELLFDHVYVAAFGR